MNFLLTLLRTPSSFYGDPWGYLRNQIGHAYVVGGGLSLVMPLWAVGLVYGVWEAIQWFREDAEAWDCVEDTAHVLSIAIAASFMFPLAALLQAIFMLSGFLRRRGEARVLEC